MNEIEEKSYRVLTEVEEELRSLLENAISTINELIIQRDTEKTNARMWQWMWNEQRLEMNLLEKELSELRDEKTVD